MTDRTALVAVKFSLGVASRSGDMVIFGSDPHADLSQGLQTFGATDFVA